MKRFKAQDFYFKKAKAEGYKARSAFKLEELQDKFHLFDKDIKNILDVGCAPGSWIQYAVMQEQKNKIKEFKIIGIDLQEVNLNLPGVRTYQADMTHKDQIKKILEENGIMELDLIQSDMAPNTIGVKDVDAIRLFGLLDEVKRIIFECLKPTGKFVVKVFMGPGFEEFIKEMKDHFGGKHIKTFKPKACRSDSKEIYVVKI